MENLKEHNMDSKLKEQLKLAKQLADERRDRLNRLYTKSEESELLWFIAELLISIEHRINNILAFQK